MYLLPLLACCIAIGYTARVHVLRVGERGPAFRMAEGEIFSLYYIHSMYGVPVTEKIRVENGHLTLYHIVSSEAALEYFGIEKNGENNAGRALVEFSIPRASIGNHELRIKHRKIRVRELAGQDEPVRITLANIPFTSYVAERVWR